MGFKGDMSLVVDGAGGGAGGKGGSGMRDLRDMQRFPVTSDSLKKV